MVILWYARRSACAKRCKGEREAWYDVFFGNHPDYSSICALNPFLDGRITPTKKPHC
jgi:hypothetical protein